MDTACALVLNKRGEGGRGAGHLDRQSGKS